jgi:glycosyltransferase involved in cell wall biosynthesis
MSGNGTPSASMPWSERPLGCVLSLPPRKRKIHYGLLSANEGFLEAVLRYSRLAEVHIFIRSHERESFKQYWEPFAIDCGRKPGSVTAIPVWHLADCLQRHLYAALHGGDPFIGGLAELRNAHASQLCPVTGITHSLSPDPLLLYYRALVSSDLLPCDGVVCSSPAAKEAFRRILRATQVMLGHEQRPPVPLQLAIIPLAIDLPEPKLTRAEARQSLGLRRDGPVLVALGRLSITGKMDLHPIFLALDRLVREKGHHDLTLLLAGSVDDQDQYLNIMMQRVHALGLTRHVLVRALFPDKEREALLRCADVFLSVADNIQESFGIAPVEAMRHELPCVLSDWDGYRSLVEDGVSGCLIPTYGGNFDDYLIRHTLLDADWLCRFYLAQATAVDVGVLVDKLDALLRAPDLRASMGRAARKRAEEQFSWRQVIPRYEAFWEALSATAANFPRSQAPATIRHLKPFAFFEHYPSRNLSGDFILTVTDRGRRAIAGKEAPAFHRELREILRAPLVRAILEDCCRHQEIAVRYIEESHSAVPRDFLHFHILWMLKHDLLAARAETF